MTNSANKLWHSLGAARWRLSRAKSKFITSLVVFLASTVLIVFTGIAQEDTKLKLEQSRPRSINRTQFLKILEGKPNAPVEILFVRDDGEAAQLSLEIGSSLKAAGWAVEEPRPIMAADIKDLAAQAPSQFGAGGKPAGVSVFWRIETNADFEREKESWPMNPDKDLNTPRKVLLYALNDSLRMITGLMSLNGRPGVLRVIVGPKPH
jgi:hypothetical protein